MPGSMRIDPYICLSCLNFMTVPQDDGILCKKKYFLLSVLNFLLFNLIEQPVFWFMTKDKQEHPTDLLFVIPDCAFLFHVPPYSSWVRFWPLHSAELFSVSCQVAGWSHGAGFSPCLQLSCVKTVRNTFPNIHFPCKHWL